MDQRRPPRVEAAVEAHAVVWNIRLYFFLEGAQVWLAMDIVAHHRVTYNRQHRLLWHELDPADRSPSPPSFTFSFTDDEYE